MAAVARKKKHKRTPDSAAATLDEIESTGDRLAAWVGENPLLIMGTAGALLLIAAIIGLAQNARESARSEASMALAEVRLDYRSAMGAPPGAFEIPEPANPETAISARTDALARYLEVANRYEGDAPGSLAMLEAGTLQYQLGETAAAIESWQTSISWLDSNTSLAGVVYERLGSAQEELGQLADAAVSYAAAAEIASYPLRYEALVNAARCLADSGDVAGALAAYDRIERESPDLAIPEHTAAHLRELRAAESL